MSANAWGGVLYRSQAKALVPKVAACLDAVDLSPDDAESYLFVALPKTRLTWVTFEPLDAVAWEELLEQGLALARSVARAVKAPAWLVANHDYSGVDVVSVDEKGRKRWAAHDDGAWRVAIDDRLLAAQERATTRAAKQAAKKKAEAELARGWARAALGRLEAEAKLTWKQHVNFAGEARVGAWRKRVKAAQREGREPRGAVAPAAPAFPGPVLGTDDLAHLKAVASHLGRTPGELVGAALARCAPRLEQLSAPVELPRSRFGVVWTCPVELDERTQHLATALARKLGVEPSAVLAAAWLLEAGALAPDHPAPSAASLSDLELAPYRRWSRGQTLALMADPRRTLKCVRLAPSLRVALERFGQAKELAVAVAFDKLAARGAPGLGAAPEEEGEKEDLQLAVLKETFTLLEKTAARLGSTVDAVASAAAEAGLRRLA